MPFIDNKAPKAPRKLKDEMTDNGYMIYWKAPKGSGWKDKAVKYVIYRFEENENISLANPSKIAAITTKTRYKLPYRTGDKKYVYVVTALDRMSNESDGVSIHVKL
jgi:hypothetical protein